LLQSPEHAAASCFTTPDIDLACVLLTLNFIPLIKSNGDGRHLYEFPFSKYAEVDIRAYESQFYSGDLQVRALALTRARQRILSAQKSGRQL
jgi:hypothetical protein